MGYYRRHDAGILRGVYNVVKLISPILLLVFTSLAFSQTEVRSTNSSYSQIPSDDLLVVVLSQPDSPLRIENARLLLNLNRNRVEYFWDARNIGAKSVSGYQIEEWWINGTGGTMTTVLKSPLNKGGVSRETVSAKQVIPITDELREKLKKDAGMSRLVVFVVKDVQFTDGTRFDGSESSKSVLSYFEKVGARIAFN